MKAFLILLLFQALLTTSAKKPLPTTNLDPDDQLRIGVKYRPPTCQKKTTHGSKVSMHYTGTIYTTGKKFDSSLDRSTPFTFTLGVGEVIQGWDRGLMGMCVGEKRKLTIPAGLAYGDAGAGHMIKGGDTLVFQVELLDIEDKDL
ncbi:hypothetical protein TrCOL_g3077 [Triparma columacea]|uniref:peptidylprolyl isomerase n=1 Tax=Triparma columacea TaxID=722753 RepID=A0A9W7G6G1_9STRA|nr:hypothetical protein TrCOL_g3077 [Triparma columacea]